MRANEFVKKRGWEQCKNILISAPVSATSFRFHNKDFNFGLYGRCSNFSENKVSLVDLKRLVESWELISAFGGIHMARADVMDLDGFEKTSPYWVKIKKAILDVESCQ